MILRELQAQGYRAAHAVDGSSALALHAAERPDLIILDWMLPGIDGLEVLRRIRQHDTTPVLMLTARGEETDLVLGMEVGADDYLTKPFRPRELIARVRALLRRSALLQQTLQADRAPSPDVLSYRGLRLDATAHHATLDGQSLDLTPTEFSLLNRLLRNPGRAFSRSYLLDTVWARAMSAAIALSITPCCDCAKSLARWGSPLRQSGGSAIDGSLPPHPRTIYADAAALFLRYGHKHAAASNSSA